MTHRALGLHMPAKRQILDYESVAPSTHARRISRLTENFDDAEAETKVHRSRLETQDDSPIREVKITPENIARETIDENKTAPRWLQRAGTKHQTEPEQNFVNPAPLSSNLLLAQSLPANETSIPVARESSPSLESTDVDVLTKSPERKGFAWSGRDGHGLSFIGVFLFTAVLYYRPYEMFAVLKDFDSMALVLAIATIAVFIPTQFGLEGTLTARPREVNLVMLLVVCGLCSILIAQDYTEAWNAFSQRFIKTVVIFIIMANVLRTKLRLHWMIYLTISISVYLSVRALIDYLAGNVSADKRVFGALGGIFENPNDLALHFVTVLPLSIALFLLSRNYILKMVFIGGAMLITIGVIVTFSRGGFLGLIGMGAVLAWKFGRRNRALIFSIFLLCVVAVFVLAPGNYIGRLATMFSSHEESAHLRSNLLTLSIKVALRHPIFGVGMGNFSLWSFGSQVTHNAYTQVASEMGLFALGCYVLFIVTPFRGLSRIELETLPRQREARFYYYWSVCLQASLAGYMISSFFASVAYQWYIYYLVAYAICVRRMYESERT